MAREIHDIKKQMTELYILNENIKAIYGLEDGKSFEDQFSPVSIESIIFYVVAFGIWVLEMIFLKHKKEVVEIIAEKEPRRTSWYREKALAFQLGFKLVADKDYYDNTDVLSENIERSKVVKYAVAVEESDKSTLYIKIAGKNKQYLPYDEVVAFESYINEVADIGVHITVINAPADAMKLELDVYYDASVLDAEGRRLDGSDDTPVQDAVRIYLANLEFNEQFVSMRLVDAIQKVEGVDIVELNDAMYRYKAMAWQSVKARYTPYAGYMTVSDSDLKINWIKS